MEVNVNANFRSRGTVRIPAKVLARLELMGEVAGNDEYGMYLSADVDPIRWQATIDPDVFEIPPQRVSPGSIRMLEVPDDLYENRWGERCYNAVVHRHPAGFSHFSQTDVDYINRFFEISFIYQKGFLVPKCIMNRMEAVGEYTTLEADVEIIDGTFSFVEEDTRKVVYPVHHDIAREKAFFDTVFARPKLRVMKEYEDLKATILAEEPDMAPDELRKKFVKSGYTPEELFEMDDSNGSEIRFRRFR